MKNFSRNTSPEKCRSTGACIVLMLMTCMACVLGQSSGGNQTRRLKIAVPVSTYKEFVSISYDDTTGEEQFNGFSIEVFKAVVNTALANPPLYDFYSFAKHDGTFNGSFDTMLQAVFNQEYDGAVGDTTLRYYRTQWVDFTYPYSETGITMMVPTNRHPNNQISRIRVIPLIKGLVSATLGFCFISALLFWFVEFKNDQKQRQLMMPPQSWTVNPPHPEHASKDDKYWQRETLRAIIHTRLVMVMWFLVLLFLTACYTASMSSLLTAQRHSAPVKTLDELIRTRANVGCQTGSFAFNVLKERGFSQSQLHSYSSEQEMVEMLSKGSNPGGVVAVIDETPYLKVFLSKQCNNDYMLVPSINLHADGFGFAFQIGSSLVHDVSKGILKVMDSGQIAKIQSQTIGDLEKCSLDDLTAASDLNLLDSDTLWILFAGAVGVTLLVIILYVVYLGTPCDTLRRRLAYPCYLLPNQERQH
ncbi:hypothetical protein vseg_002250 [Gypsophila vaccaria]